MERTLTFYERIAHQNTSDPKARLKMAEAYRRVGGIRERLGQAEQASAAYQKALGRFLQARCRLPQRPGLSTKSGAELCQPRWSMDATSSFRADPEREQAYAKALRLQEQLAHEHPGNLEYLHDLGWTYDSLGTCTSTEVACPPRPEGPVRQALDIREQLVEARPGEFLYRQELGGSLGNLGDFLMMTGRYDQAEEVVRRDGSPPADGRRLPG